MGEIIQMFWTPPSRERFEKSEEARTISIAQKNCSHSLLVDENKEDHHCEKCGKKFNSHEALLFVLHNRNQKVEMESYNLRNEIYFLTEKRDGLKSDIEFLRKEKRAATKEFKLKI